MATSLEGRTTTPDEVPVSECTRVRRPDYIPLCTIAGSDPTGGAGLQGDLKTFAAHGARGTGVVTAVTVQGWRGVSRVVPVAPEVVAEQVAVVLEEVMPRAWKTGMLWDGPTVLVVAAALARRGTAPLVVDPVLGASAGGDLAEAGSLRTMTRALFPVADLVTPNLPEAARLLGRAAVGDAEAEEAGRALLDQGCRAVLVKGGHGTGPESVDVLVTRLGVRRYALPRLAGANVHGTGCALSASLAARLGRGEPLESAVEGAKAYVHRALLEARRHGSGGSLVHAVPP
jgi:hydroxymethylpyrimidine/phosphomethylpyrimidine kinase